MASNDPSPEALRPGVTVRFVLPGASARVASRFMLSSGTVAASRGPGPRHHPAALVPAEPWRRPIARELSMLIAAEDAGWRRAEDLALLSLPEEVVAPLAAICDECGLYDPDANAAGTPEHHLAWARAHRGLVEHLGPYRVEGRPIDATVVYRSDPGLATVTKVDRGTPDREAHVGLHVDSWEGVSLRGRDAVRNRICVNLSRHRRDFLFVNQTLGAMMRALGLDDSRDVDLPGLFAGHAFLRRFPAYPVVKLTLEHGEAYVAPTGNIVHDGASAPGTQPDVAMHLLGYFAVPRAHTVMIAATTATSIAIPSENA